MTQYQLGQTLVRLGSLRSDPKRLKEAIVAYRAEQEIVKREADAMSWAATEVEIARTLLELGKITNEVKHLDEAKLAAQSAVQIDADDNDWKAVLAEIEAAIRTMSGGREN